MQDDTTRPRPTLTPTTTPELLGSNARGCVCLPVFLGLGRFSSLALRHLTNRHFKALSSWLPSPANWVLGNSVPIDVSRLYRAQRRNAVATEKANVGRQVLNSSAHRRRPACLMNKTTLKRDFPFRQSVLDSLVSWPNVYPLSCAPFKRVILKH